MLPGRPPKWSLKFWFCVHSFSTSFSLRLCAEAFCAKEAQKESRLSRLQRMTCVRDLRWCAPLDFGENVCFSFFNIPINRIAPISMHGMLFLRPADAVP